MRRLLYDMAYRAVYPGFDRLVREIGVQRQLPYSVRMDGQIPALQQLLEHAFSYVPYYRNLAQQIGISSSDIRCVDDLCVLPVLRKKQIKENPELFMSEKPLDYKVGRTGGSTGEPLQYRISKDAYYRGTAELVAVREELGYHRGDKMIVFAGGSLVGGKSPKVRIIEKCRNFKAFSSCGVTEEDLSKIYDFIRRHKKLYISGYASSLALLADYCLTQNDRVTSIKACFTTSEKLTAQQRETITVGMNTDLYDFYGLVDGGASAYECKEHRGMHLSAERAVIQLCNDDGLPVVDNAGHVITTDLYNYAFPFIRYDTGDTAIIDYGPCPCGNQAPRIVEITARTVDTLTLNGTLINGNALTVLMSKTHADMYRIVQVGDLDVNVSLLFVGKSKMQERSSIELVSRFFAEKAPLATVSVTPYHSYLEFPKSPNKHKSIENLSRRGRG